MRARNAPASSATARADWRPSRALTGATMELPVKLAQPSRRSVWTGNMGPPLIRDSPEPYLLTADCGVSRAFATTAKMEHLQSHRPLRASWPPRLGALALTGLHDGTDDAARVKVGGARPATRMPGRTPAPGAARRQLLAPIARYPDALLRHRC